MFPSWNDIWTPNLFQESLFSEAKTLPALSLGHAELKEKGMQALPLVHERLSWDRIPFLLDTISSTGNWSFNTQSCKLWSLLHTTACHHRSSSLIFNARQKTPKKYPHTTCQSFPHNKMFWHWTVCSNESRLVSLCPCVWEFCMLSGPQILDVLSCEAALIATLWPYTLWLPKAHIKSNIPPKFDWNWNEKIQEPCDMASGVPF